MNILRSLRQGFRKLSYHNTIGSAVPENSMLHANLIALF